MTARGLESGASLAEEHVGRKAVGLLELPSVWTPEFLVVGVDEVASIASALGDADGERLAIGRIVDGPKLSGLIRTSDRLIVRSSAVGEGINARGSFESVECASEKVDLVQALLEAVTANEARRGESNFRMLALIVQRFVAPRRRGHASNERRVSRRHDSWLIEVTGAGDELIDQFRVTDKPSRLLGRGLAPFRVAAESELGEALRDLTASTSSLGSRGRRHLEWIWDGSQLWIVQNDIETPYHGGSPGDGWTREPVGLPSQLSTFVNAKNASGDWQKARCVRVFAEIGLPTSDLFVLEDAAMLELLATPDSALPPQLVQDIVELCRAPVVVRSDRTRSPSGDGVLLPRTETCLVVDQVVKFMRDTAKYFIDADVGASEFCFLVHRFIPARSGTYSLARPNVAKVRVDATWGVPDGLLYLPHDSFEVDLRDLDATWSKLRCKHAYFDIRHDGTWYERAAGSPWDWAESIDRDDLQAVAKQAALIAEHVGKPVEVMHFIRPSASTGLPNCLPWYFRETDASARPVDRAPVFSRSRRIIQTPDDLDVLVDELESSTGDASSIGLSASCDFLRDKDFVQRVGIVAVMHGLPVDLHGSVLAHVFYMLRAAGVNVRAYEHAEPPPPEPRVFDKLVRDDIPRTIERSGERAVSVRATGEELQQLLQQKVVEESLELFAATTPKEVLAETADLVEVVEALCLAFDLSEADLRNAMRAKRESRGGFSDGVVLKSTFVPSALPSLDEGALFETDAPMLSGVPRQGALHGRNARVVRVSRVPSVRSSSGSIVSVGVSDFTGNIQIRNDRQQVEIEFIRDATAELEGQLPLFGLDGTNG
jgi:predicted house-cleaning noncanonical NTP pyrophosphatase (MazG superfamily)